MAPPAITYNQVKDLKYQKEIVETAINDIYQAEKGSIIKVDALSNIGKHASEYIYFRTDHHWTGRGAYYAYEAFCESIGEKATPLEEMEIKKPNYEFLGSLYNFTGNNPLLLDSKDQAEIHFTQKFRYKYHLQRYCNVRRSSIYSVGLGKWKSIHITFFFQVTM